MIAEPLMDPSGALLVEVRGDVDVVSLVSDRVRFNQPAAGDVVATPADGSTARTFRSFIVLSGLVAVPDPDVPVTFARYSARCYGATTQNAWAVWGALVKAVHRVGPRLKASGLGIYQTLITGGGEEGFDPDTKQPVVSGVITLVATAQAVTD